MAVSPWATLADLPATRPTLGGDGEWNRILLAASEVLYGLTGRRLGGIRERAIELYAPHPSTDVRPLGGLHSVQALHYAQWDRQPCRPRGVRLPNRPVVELLAVRDHDGNELPRGNYRIARGGYLEAAPGHRHALLPTAHRPLRLRYRYGRDPGDAGRVQAATLAFAIGQAIAEPESSPLPGVITQIVRQGVTFTQQAASALIELGMTGLGPVDMWVASVNPNRQQRPGRAWSPDTDAPHYPLDLEEVP